MSLITDKIESLNSDNEEQQNMKVQLQTLAQLAASQNDANRISLENNLQSGEVAGGVRMPCIKVRGIYQKTYTVTNEEIANLTNKISDELRLLDLEEDKLYPGIAKMLFENISDLIGEGEGKEAKSNQSIFAIEYPSATRFDFAIWVRNTRGSALMEHCKSVISVVAFKSAIDIGRVDIKDFFALYKPLFDLTFAENEARGAFHDVIGVFQSYHSHVEFFESTQLNHSFSASDLIYKKEVCESSIIEF